jgi:signal transduction histidine kinase
MTDVAAESGLLSESPPARRARRIGLIAILVTAGLAFGEHPAPELTGRGLGVSLAIAVLLASAVAFARSNEERLTVAALGSMIVASAGLVWVQPGGAGDTGLFVAVAFAGIRLTNSQAVGAWLLAAATCLPAAIVGHRAVGGIIETELGIAAFHFVARFARSATEANMQTQRLLAELQASREATAEAAMLRERGRLARDMHDVLAHSLSGLMLQLEGARMLAAQSDSDGQLPPALDRAHHLARAGLEEARRAIAALRDEELPGPDRLAQLAADFEQDSHVRTSIESTGNARELDSESSLTIYRVAQEALTNIRRHATPDSVQISLSYDSGGTRLTVRDRATTPSAVRRRAVREERGYGLTGMRERAELLGGSLNAGRTSDGFCVELWIPA